VRWKDLPIIVVTELSSRESVIQAAGLGIKDYILKQRFTTAELLTRVRKYVAPISVTAADSADPARAASSTSTPPAPVSGLTTSPVIADAAELVREAAKALGVPLLTREQMMRRIAAAPVKTLPGAVAELIAIVSSPRGTMADLAHTLKQDPVLASRVLRMANSAAYASQKPRITTIEEAVKNVGLNGVQNMVMSVGVFETFGSGGDVGLLHCWQHSLAVAALMEILTPVGEAAPQGVPYVVGLCHDLVEIVLRQYFHDAYVGVSRVAAKTGVPLRRVETEVFGIAYDELAMVLMSRLGLPQVITAPIQELFERASNPKSNGVGSILGRCLRAANVYAHGLMLAPSLDEPVLPLGTVECRHTFGDGPLPSINATTVRSDAITAATLLGGLSSSETAKACEPFVPKRPIQACYVRHVDYADLDPLHAFLRLTCDAVDLRTELPARAEDLGPINALVVAAPRTFTEAEVQQQLAQLEPMLQARGAMPVLYLCGLDSAPALAPPADGKPGVTVQRLPANIGSLGAFLKAARDAQLAAGRPATRAA
jgi:HD-like signal output (HDOD) protein